MALALNIENYALSGNPVFAYLSGATNPGIDYFYLKVYVKNSAGVYTEYGEERLLSDADGNAVTDIQDYLKKPNPVFKLANTDIFSEFDTLLQYRLSYKRTGDVSYTTQDFYALQGGVDDEFLQQLVNLETTFYQFFYVTGKRFVTMQPNYKRVPLSGYEKLFFLATATATAALKVFLTFSDGTTATETILPSLNLTANTIYQIHCSYSDLNLAQYAVGKTIVSYQVFLYSGSTEISERRIFIVDDVEYPNQRFFAFQNSLGTFDMIRFLGTAAIYDEFDRTEVLIDDRRLALRNTNEEYHEVNTGWLNLQFPNLYDAEEYGTELMLSTNIFVIKNGFEMPVLVTNKKELKHKDNEFLRNIKLTFYLTKKKSSIQTLP